MLKNKSSQIRKSLKLRIKSLLGKRQKLIVISILVFIKSIWFHFLDFILVPFTIISAFSFKAMRLRKFTNLPLSKKILFKVGVYPIVDHYYEPMFNPKYLRKSLRENRSLPGIDLNIQEQLKILDKFNFNDELSRIPTTIGDDSLEFYHNDGPFPPADAEYLYNMIRFLSHEKLLKLGVVIQHLWLQKQ